MNPNDPNAQMDLSNVPDATEYVLVPPGRYQIVVTECERTTSTKNNPTWKLKLRILGGEYDGVTLLDNITFTQGGLPRVKWVFEHLGDVDISKPFRVGDVNLVGKQAIADVFIEESKKEATGEIFQNNKVKFTGYSRPEGFQYLPVPGANGGAQASAGQAPSAQQPVTAPQAQGTSPAASTPAGPAKKMPF